MFRKKYLWPIMYSILLLSFTIYVLLDTFVITRVYMEVPSTEGTSIEAPEGNISSIQYLVKEENSRYQSQSDSAQENADANLTETLKTPVITDTTYMDEEITIFITEYREYDTAIYGFTARHLYHSGIATLTVGSFVRGILDIYGTTNLLTQWYWRVGIFLLLMGFFFFMIGNAPKNT